MSSFVPLRPTGDGVAAIDGDLSAVMIWRPIAERVSVQSCVDVAQRNGCPPFNLCMQIALRLHAYKYHPPRT